MLAAAMYFLRSKNGNAAYYIEESAKTALDVANDTDFAWKAALYAEAARRILAKKS